MKLSKYVLIGLIIIGCSQSSKESETSLTDGEKEAIEAMSVKLASSLNNSDFKYFRSIWSDEMFGQRVKKSRVNASVYNHFQKEIVNTVRNLNSTLILDLNEFNGKAECTKIDYYNSHDEISFHFIYQKVKGISFYKFRIEPDNDGIRITDVFDLKNETWFSDHVVRIMEINAKHDAYSEKRRNLNIALREAEYSKQQGDYYSALEFMYEIPNDYSIGNWLSLERLEIASNLDDTTYFSVLETEFENNKSIYLQYLHSYNFDSVSFQKVLNSLKDQTKSSWIDSLENESYFWN